MADDRLLAPRLAKRLVATRAAFAAAFALAQQRAGLTEPVDFKLVGTDLGDLAAFTQGLAHAAEKGWYKYLLAVCVEQELLPLQLAGKGKRRRKTPVELQSIVDVDSGFARGEIELPGYFRLSRQTCRILIAGDPAGTGVLVAPNIVLTAWHVVRDQIDVTNPAGHQPKPGSDQRITVEFQDIDLAGGATQPEIFAVAIDWLRGASPCHPDEITRSLPEVGALAGLNDFALIKLATDPGTTRGCVDLTRTVDASQTKKVQIFQHPRGFKLRRSEGNVGKMYGANRFLHRANTLDGSSGAPCVDAEFRFVGFHQAGLKPGEGATPKSFNRGVPITALLTDIQPRLVQETVPMVLEAGDPPVPVIGRDQFQTLVRAAAGAGGGGVRVPQLLLVRVEQPQGEAVAARHSELVVARQLLDKLLPASTEKFLPFSATSLPARPETLIREMARLLGDTDADNLVLPPEAESGTTRPSWIRDQLVPAFVAAIGKHAAARRIWLVIDDLDLHAVPPGPVPEFLSAVYEQLPNIGWLRVVLFGYSGTVSPKAAPVLRQARLADPTEAELATYFERRFPSDLTPETARETAAVTWAGAQARVTGTVRIGEALRLEVAELPFGVG